MIHYRTALLAGVCSVCLCFQFNAADIGHAASLVEASDSFDARRVGYVAPRSLADQMSVIRLAQTDSGATSAGESSDEATATPAWAAEATMNPDYNTGEADAAAPADATDAQPAAAAADEPAPVSLGGQATTSYFGGTPPPVNPAWAGEATMNPDYTKTEADVAAPAEAEPAASQEPAAAAAEEPAPVSLGGQATTSYFGGTPPPVNPAWAAEATMNPDYTKTEADVAAPAEPEPAASQEPAAAAVEEPAPVSLGGQATTSFFGDTKPTGSPAWAAEASMNPDYSQSAPATDAASTPEPAAADSVRNAAVEECQGAVNSAVKDSKLLFSEAGYGLSGTSRSALNKVAEALRNCGEVVIEISGHTDNVGTPENNKALSGLRAKEVVEFLVGAGVEAGKLKAVGYGQEKPAADNASADGRRLNRRVEIQVSGH